MHLMMMLMYAAIASTVMATVDPRSDSNRQRVVHGLKMFGYFLGIGLLLSWVLFPLPW